MSSVIITSKIVTAILTCTIPGTDFGLIAKMQYDMSTKPRVHGTGLAVIRESGKAYRTQLAYYSIPWSYPMTAYYYTMSNSQAAMFDANPNCPEIGKPCTIEGTHSLYKREIRCQEKQIPNPSTITRSANSRGSVTPSSNNDYNICDYCDELDWGRMACKQMCGQVPYKPPGGSGYHGGDW